MLVRDTEISRATVSQEWRKIVDVDTGNHTGGAHRRVHIVIPQDTVVFISLDAEAGGTLGLNRTYKGAPFTHFTFVPFRLLPGQVVWAASETGPAPLGVIIEYHAD